MHTRGLEIQLHSFSTLVPEGGDWSIICSTSWKETQYPLNSRLGGPHSQSGHFREQKIFFPLARFKPDYSAHSLVSISITLTWLPTHYYFNSANLWVCHFFNSCMCYWKWHIWCSIILNLHLEGMCVRSQPDYTQFLVFPHQFCDATCNRP
jgi:hypothetical protein